MISISTPDWIQPSTFHFLGTGIPKWFLKVISRVSSGGASFCLPIEWSCSHTCWLNPMFLSSTFSSQADTFEGITLWVCLSFFIFCNLQKTFIFFLHQLLIPIWLTVHFWYFWKSQPVLSFSLLHDLDQLPASWFCQRLFVTMCIVWSQFSMHLHRHQFLRRLWSPFYPWNVSANQGVYEHENGNMKSFDVFSYNVFFCIISNFKCESKPKKQVFSRKLMKLRWLKTILITVY